MSFYILKLLHVSLIINVASYTFSMSTTKQSFIHWSPIWLWLFIYLTIQLNLLVIVVVLRRIFIIYSINNSTQQLNKKIQLFYLTIQLNLVVFCNCIKNNFCCVHSINLVRIQLTVPHPTPQIVLFIIYYSVNYSPCTYICFTLLTSYSM